ncbi:MAG: hypothetical protein RLZZ127_3024 [Planctomycetota bacterium]|jgi:hypothetical protein
MATHQFRGQASQFYVAAELCRRGFHASVTLGNCPDFDVVALSKSGRILVTIQVKTYVLGQATCAVGMKAQEKYGKTMFWVLTGLPIAEEGQPEFYIIPSETMAREVRRGFENWVGTKGKHGQDRDKNNRIRTVHMPPHVNRHCPWDLTPYRNAWDPVTRILRDMTPT